MHILINPLVYHKGVNTYSKYCEIKLRKWSGDKYAFQSLLYRDLYTVIRQLTCILDVEMANLELFLIYGSNLQNAICGWLCRKTNYRNNTSKKYVWIISQTLVHHVLKYVVLLVLSNSVRLVQRYPKKHCGARFAMVSARFAIRLLEQWCHAC